MATCWFCDKEVEKIPVCICCILQRNLLKYLGVFQKYIDKDV